MFDRHILNPESFAARFAQLLPEYLPGVDTGAFAATDRRRCWNKTLKHVLTVIGDEKEVEVVADAPPLLAPADQLALIWERGKSMILAATTGWGDRKELDRALDIFLGVKCPQKLFVYTCSKWQEAVIEQIDAALLRYPYHLAGEQYLFMNLLGAENRFHLAQALFSADGPPDSAQTKVLRPVPGSPFTWAL